MNKFFDKLPFKRRAEKIPEGIRVKVPVLNKAIPFANQIACGLIIVLVIIIIACSGGKGKGNNSLLLGLAEKYYGERIKFWENQITETDAEKAPGFIARGKFNLKVTGPMTKQQLVALVGAIRNLKNENVAQLVRLDLSETTNLKMSSGEYDNEASFDGANLGSIVLPDGLTSISNFAFRGCPLFEINPIPASVKNIYDQAFGSTCLSRIVFPANFKWEPSALTFYSSLLASTVVFSEGHEVVNLYGIGNYLANWNNSPIPPMTLVFPSTLKQIGCEDNDDPFRVSKNPDFNHDLYEGIDTLYFYGETPPEVVSARDMFFKNIKKIYVPQSAIKAYEDAYFSIGKVTVKPLPKDNHDIASWSRPFTVDQKAILKEYKKAAAKGKRNAKERDKKVNEAIKRKLQGY